MTSLLFSDSISTESRSPNIHTQQQILQYMQENNLSLSDMDIEFFHIRARKECLIPPTYLANEACKHVIKNIIPELYQSYINILQKCQKFPNLLYISLLEKKIYEIIEFCIERIKRQDTTTTQQLKDLVYKNFLQQVISNQITSSRTQVHNALAS